MAIAPTKDDVITQLLKIVNEKKEEIAKTDRPDWKTNMSFSPTESASDAKNIQTITDVNYFVKNLALLINAKEKFDKAASILGVKSTYKHGSFTYEQWEADFITRMSKIQVAEKKKELANLEERLSKLISPEERERLELVALMDSVNNL